MKDRSLHQIYVLFVLSSAISVSALNVSVTNAPYNAKGDGRTLDRVAIQSAIDAVGAAGGGTVTVGGGKTYLISTLEMKSNVTLQIDANTTLLSSLNLSDYPHTTVYGRRPGDVQWSAYQERNYPMIFFGPGTSNVKVTGSGTLRRTINAKAMDAGNIMMVMVGCFMTNGFEISGIKFRQSFGYHINLQHSNNGLVSGVNMDSVWTGDDYNCDGVSIVNSQNIRVTNCYIRSNDDLIYPKSSWNDPRGIGWWNSNDPQPTKNIEIDHNTLIIEGRSIDGPSDINFINWGGACPDLSKTEVSGINIHDNDLSGEAWGIGFRHEPDPYHEQPQFAPVKDLSIRNNNLHGLHNTMPDWDITNLDWPGSGFRSNSTFVNPGFETNGVCYWSLRPDDSTRAGARNNAVGQTGTWYGYIDNLDKGDAKIFQGLYRAAGNHRFTAKVQSSGATVRMFVRDNSGNPIACKQFSNTSWTTLTLDWTAPAAGNYQIGIERGSASSGWARIDDAVIASGGNGGTGGCGTTAMEFDLDPKISLNTPSMSVRGDKILIAGTGLHRVKIINLRGEVVLSRTVCGPSYLSLSTVAPGIVTVINSDQRKNMVMRVPGAAR